MWKSSVLFAWVPKESNDTLRPVVEEIVNWHASQGCNLRDRLKHLHWDDVDAGRHATKLVFGEEAIFRRCLRHQCAAIQKRKGEKKLKDGVSFVHCCPRTSPKCLSRDPPWPAGLHHRSGAVCRNSHALAAILDSPGVGFGFVKGR